MTAPTGAERQPVIVVSGLPRSGTSMMMRMLAAGGVRLLVDGVRQPDPSNPLGFFEFERVKQMPRGDVAWLADAAGCAVKIVSPLLRHLPGHLRYDVVFMRRPLDEIMASQAAMLSQRGATWDAAADARVRSDYAQHLRGVQAWLSAQSHIRMLGVSYGDAIAAPDTHAAQVAAFLGRELDVPAMAAAVEQALHRQRAADVHR